MSIPLALAHLESGLNDAQVQSLVHQLRHEYATLNGAPTLAQPDWDHYRADLRRRVEYHPDLRAQRRTGMLTRIDGAAAAPAPDMIYAAQRIRERAVLSARLLQTHLAREAARVGLPDDQAMEIYQAGCRTTSGGRRERASDQQRAQWAMLPLDPRTRDGLAALAQQPDVPEIPLITEHQAVTWLPSQQISVTRVGYHRDSQRLEILTDDGQVLAYRDVNVRRYEHLLDQRSTLEYEIAVRGMPMHQYATAGQADAAGVRRRCGRCGQFCGAAHRCPGSHGGHRGQLLTATSRFLAVPPATETLQGEGVAGFGRVDTVAFAAVAERLHQHPDQTVEFPLSVDAGELSVSGSIRAGRDEHGGVSIDTGFLGCRCAEFTTPQGCEHTREIADRLRTSLDRSVQQWTDQQAAAAAAAIAATAAGSAPPPAGADPSGVATSATTRPAVDALLPAMPNLSTFRYSQEPDRFAHDVRDVLQRVNDVGAEAAVPYLTGQDHPVLYGFGADRRFGIELEYDTHDYNRSQLIPQRLYEAQLTAHMRRGGYHSTLSRGYHDNLHRGWSLENDSTVSGGELVSPILHDCPQAWSQLSQACTTIRAHGGGGGPEVGGHITVSAPEQAGQAVRLTRFLRVIHHFQDDLYVMGSAGHGRGHHWSRPLQALPPAGYTRMGQVPRHERYQAVNLGHITATSTDSHADQSRIEFRLWDGSIEPGRIQAQIRMSTALLDYATHDRTAIETLTQRDQTGPINPHDGTQLADRTTNLRELLDRLFRRDQDKQQALALWVTGLHHSGMHRQPR